MTPREIDALVAEKVMGWEKRLRIPMHGLGTATEILVPPYDPTEKHPPVNIPHYSTDIADAWSVVEKLRAHERFFIEWWPSQNVWNCNGILAETAPLSICMAALKSCKVKT